MNILERLDKLEKNQRRELIYKIDDQFLDEEGIKIKNEIKKEKEKNELNLVKKMKKIFYEKIKKEMNEEKREFIIDLYCDLIKKESNLKPYYGTFEDEVEKNKKKHWKKYSHSCKICNKKILINIDDHYCSLFFFYNYNFTCNSEICSLIASNMVFFKKDSYIEPAKMIKLHNCIYYEMPDKKYRLYNKNQLITNKDIIEI